MKLWLLSQDVCKGYDTYNSVVVAAKTEQEAKQILPNEYLSWDSAGQSWAYKPEEVSAELIGTAISGTKEGVILSSFNAG